MSDPHPHLQMPPECLESVPETIPCSRLCGHACFKSHWFQHNRSLRKQWERDTNFMTASIKFIHKKLGETRNSERGEHKSQTRPHSSSRLNPSCAPGATTLRGAAGEPPPATATSPREHFLEVNGTVTPERKGCLTTEGMLTVPWLP